MKVQSDRPITYLVLQRTNVKKLLEEMLYVKRPVARRAVLTGWLAGYQEGRMEAKKRSERLAFV
jgi:hypothetical protein